MEGEERERREDEERGLKERREGEVGECVTFFPPVS